MENLIDGYERTVKTLKRERDEFKKQKQVFMYIILFLLIIGGFYIGYINAINSELRQKIESVLDSPKVPDTVKNDIMGK